MSTTQSTSVSGINLLNVVVGTITNDSALAGNVGEYITSMVPVGSAVALTSGVASNVTSMSVPAGDWDITGVVNHNIGVLTSITQANSGISLTSAALTGQAGGGGLGTDPTITMSWAAVVLGANIIQNIPVVRVSLNATTTIYLIVQDSFTVSTISAFGTIRARRVR